MQSKNSFSIIPFGLKAAVSVTALLTASAALSAQDSYDASDEAPEEIIVIDRVLFSDQVNSLRAPTPIIDVPQSLSLYSADEILERGFTSIAQIVNYTPGVNNSQGEGHRDAIVFRGVRSTADFFIDGARDDVQYYRPLYNLEQVEILRGPNALLFGRGGTGGILNRVTKKGVVGEDFNRAQASVDTFGAVGVQIDTNISTTDRSAVRLNAMYEHLDNHRDFYDGDRYGINPTARFLLGSATTVDLSYEYVNHERFIDRGIPTGADGRPVEAFKDIVFGDPVVNTTTLEAHLLRAAVQHEFSDSLKGNFSAFYGDYDKFYGNFYASNYSSATPDRVELDGYEDATDRQNLILSSNLVAEATTGSIGHTLIAGVEYINTSSDQNRFNPTWSTTGTDREEFSVLRPLALSGSVGINADGLAAVNDFSLDLNDDTRVTINVLSAYIQDQIELTDWAEVVVGARFDSFDIDVNDVKNGTNLTRTDDRISPRFGLILKPRDNISLYASYSETFLPRSGEQFSDLGGGRDALDPNTFTNLEAGIKWDIQDGLSLTAAVFEVEQTSPQTDDNDPDTLDVITSVIRGFEFQITGRINEYWFITGGYSYLDGEQVAGGGARPRELPEHMVSLWNNVQVTDQLGLGIGMTHQGRSFITNNNTAILPAFTRFDAAAFYDLNDRVRLQVNIENLTDELYFPNSHSTHQATVAPPLNARFAVTVDF